MYFVLYVLCMIEIILVCFEVIVVVWCGVDFESSYVVKFNVCGVFKIV